MGGIAFAMRSIDDGPQLISRFSSDGEESFVNRPETLKRPVSRGKAQNLASQDRVVNERGTEEGSGTGSRLVYFTSTYLSLTPLINCTPPVGTPQSLACDQDHPHSLVVSRQNYVLIVLLTVLSSLLPVLLYPQPARIPLFRLI